MTSYEVTFRDSSPLTRKRGHPNTRGDACVPSRLALAAGSSASDRSEPMPLSVGLCPSRLTLSYSVPGNAALNICDAALSAYLSTFPE